MRRRLLSVALFLCVFAGLHLSYQSLRGTAVERLMVHTLTVRPAAWLVGKLTPQLYAVADGPTLRTSAGALNVRAGCEGTEVLFLLLAALVIAPIDWRRKPLGMLLGTALVLALNQARILALFYSVLRDRELFDLLHGYVLPVALIVLTGIFFYWWTEVGTRADVDKAQA
jgi:exosortase family protein XrtM